MMNARLGQPHVTAQVPRKISLVSAPAKGLQEVAISADAVLLGADAAADGQTVTLIVGEPEGSGPVRRKLWMVAQGDVLPVEAQNGEFLGHTLLLDKATGSSFYAVVFMETQKQAIERATYRAGFRPPPGASNV
jgi:hypothetical protein